MCEKRATVSQARSIAFNSTWAKLCSLRHTAPSAVSNR